jgi:hypothetical protein
MASGALRAAPFLALGVLGAAGLYAALRAPAAPQPAVPAQAPPLPDASAPVDTAPPTPAPAPPPPAPAPPAAKEGPRTIVDDEATRDRLIGTHPVSLQWISWGKYGRVTFEDDGGLIRLTGEQRARGDFLKIDGVITRVEKKAFTFEGVIETRVSHIAGGRTCRREGTYHFRAAGKRRYFRLREKYNPCEKPRGPLDYVDIYWTHAVD